ncbi:MAG: PrsW family intramembrane metalloprotease [Polyangiaceae bacterium]|nr:PrsW family intramembrane metalloprotease [Polyangiaceae bacterium]MCK6536449.1 PrsW family intramembrane metalloprotease [Polyangiaceae bacterium]
MIIALFIAIILVSVCVFFYGLAIKGVDRYEPEPWWLLVLCFFWGALGATFFSLIFNTIGGTVVMEAMGPSQAAQGLTASFIAPPVEESFKGVFLLVVWAASALWLKEVDGALDGAIYGGVIGLGFTLTEDVLYIMRGTAQGGLAAFTIIFFLRTILGGLGHATFTAMTGVGVGVAAESRSILVKVIAPIGGWTAAVGLHFLHNFLVSFFGGAGVLLKLAVFFTFDILFFVLLYILAFRDRAIVVRNLVDEVGVMLHPKEFRTSTSAGQLIPLWNVLTLKDSPTGYMSARKKQLALSELAFLKHRRRRGETGTSLDRREQELRGQIQQANAQGVFIGKR